MRDNQGQCPNLKKQQEKKSVVGEQLGRADPWAIHQERNKDKQLEIWDIKKTASGLADGIWWLSAARVRHSSRAPGQGVWQTASPGGCQRLRSSRKRRRQGNCKGACSFSFSTFVQCLPTSVSSSWAIFSPHPFCRKDPALRPAVTRGTVIIVAIKAVLLHTLTNVQKHLLLTALTNTEDGYGNEEWNRWFLGGHTLLPFLSLTF